MSEPFDPQAFLDEVATDLVTSAPSDVQEAIISDEKLRAEVLDFQAHALEGLTLVAGGGMDPEALERDLRIRKSAVVARAQLHNYTIEKLVAAAITKVMAKAREIRG